MGEEALSCNTIKNTAAAVAASAAGDAAAAVTAAYRSPQSHRIANKVVIRCHQYSNLFITVTYGWNLR